MDVKRQLDVLVFQTLLSMLPLIVLNLRLIGADSFWIFERLLNALISLFISESLIKNKLTVIKY